MGFFEKLRKAILKIKTKLIVYTVIAVIIVIWGVAPYCTALYEAKMNSGLAKWVEDPFNGTFWNEFILKFGTGITTPLEQLAKCFNDGYIQTFLGALKVVGWIYLFFALIGLIKAFPKHEYEDIENGSSDWSENGEQYKVLSRNKGIVLAEKNYLPVDKRGNVNVLVVRRFWCW